MGGECRRVSIFLSVFDVHVQNAPVSGRWPISNTRPGQYLNALQRRFANYNENVLLGFEAVRTARRKNRRAADRGGDCAAHSAVRSKTTKSARRTHQPHPVRFARGRLSAANSQIKVQLDDHAVGGETVMAKFE